MTLLILNVPPLPTFQFYIATTVGKDKNFGFGFGFGLNLGTLLPTKGQTF